MQAAFGIGPLPLKADRTIDRRVVVIGGLLDPVDTAPQAQFGAPQDAGAIV